MRARGPSAKPVEVRSSEGLGHTECGPVVFVSCKGTFHDAPLFLEVACYDCNFSTRHNEDLWCGGEVRELVVVDHEGYEVIGNGRNIVHHE